jgi:2,3-bisphosphoglycerate-dependent phosphoglycerate mutase
MQFFFIRHAQSTNNALAFETGEEIGRSEDPEITQVGAEQAKLLAKFLQQGDPKELKHCDDTQGNGFGITHLYCSLMLRSVQTGTIIARQLGLPLVALERIHECGGIYLADEETGKNKFLPGKSKAYFENHFPELILPEDIIQTGWWDKRPVETREDCIQRARAYLETLIGMHSGEEERVAIISHGGFYNDLLNAVLKLPNPNGAWFSLYNAAMTRIDFHEDMVELVYQNRLDYLPCELIT